MIYIARLGPFLSSMDYFGKLADEIKLFPEGSKSAEYIWVSSSCTSRSHSVKADLIMVGPFKIYSRCEQMADILFWRFV